MGNEVFGMMKSRVQHCLSFVKKSFSWLVLNTYSSWVSYSLLRFPKVGEVGDTVL